MRVAFTYGGRLKHDYIGAYVMYRRQGIDVLGIVTAVYNDEDETATFRVHHLDGSRAPDVPCGCVEVLERTYPPAGVSD